MDKEIDSPEILSAQTTVLEFETWKNKLINYLKQDSDHRLFLENGPYANWANEGKRIQQLNFDFEMMDEKLPGVLNTDRSMSLLLKRNVQLDDFIELICELSNHLGEETIMDHATSFEKILEIIEGCLCLSSKTESILELSKLKYKDGEQYESFYKRFRTMICDYASKKYVEANDGLLVEEIISPTFEEVIILWCLEKIDQELPLKVEQKFGSEFSSSSLHDLKDKIFLAIPDLLESNVVLYDHETLLEVDENGKTNIKMESVGEKIQIINKDSTNIKAEPIKEIATEKVTPINADTSDDITQFCVMCDSHISEAIYQEHIKTCNNKSYPCNLCYKVFDNTNDYRNHGKTHVIRKVENCEICLSRVHPNSLAEHREKQHSERFCCDEFFKSDWKLYIHKKNHKEKDLKFQCHTCCTSLVSLKALELHSKNCNSDKQGFINIEPNGNSKNCVSSSVNVNQSSMLNSKDKEDVCPEDQVFINIEPKEPTEDLSDQTDQIITVNGVKYIKKTFTREDYSCIVCQKILSSKENLKIHMYGHFPGAENTDLFAQLMANMKPIKVDLFYF